MITNYIPNTCGYGLNNLKKVVHIFSESANVVHIDNGGAYVTSGITNFQTIKAASVSFEETVSYDDRFKFQKTVTATVNGFWKLSELGGKYYVALEDENGVMWLVNADFPSLVTYTYTLQDGTDETVFTFSALSNFPTLKLNASVSNSYECKNYAISRVDELKMLEKRYANLNASSGIIYGYSNQVYKTVKFNEGSFKLEESFDGVDASTTIQFDIDFDAYQSSWHYNILEYPYNKYVAVVDHLACGFEMGLVPSYNVQGSHQIGGGDTVTVTLVGGSQRGSEWAESWMEVTVAPQYTWRLSKEFECQQTRWVVVSDEFMCSGTTKMTKEKRQISYDSGTTWTDIIPLETRPALPVIEYDSVDCGYVPQSSGTYLTFVAEQNGSFTLSGNGVSYSLDNGNTWNSLGSNEYSPSVQAGNKIMWKAIIQPRTTSPYGVGRFSSTGRFSVEGNPMSLLYGDNFEGQTDLTGKDMAFRHLFSGCTGLINAENVSLPATTLSDYCYSWMFTKCPSLTKAPRALSATTLAYGCCYSMFFECTSLTTVPSLPAMNLAEECYGSMFADCTSLTTVPNNLLPATTLAKGCYLQMFWRCSSLTTAPELSATILAEECYGLMFIETSLNYIKCLATDISANRCTYRWLSNVASSGTFVKNSSMSSWTEGDDGIPDGWTIQDAT